MTSDKLVESFFDVHSGSFRFRRRNALLKIDHLKHAFPLTQSIPFVLSRAAATHAPARAPAAKAGKGGRKAPLPMASESDALATTAAPATVSAPNSSVIQHNARTAAAAPTTSAGSVLQAPPTAASAAASNRKGGWKKRTHAQLTLQRTTPPTPQPPTPAVAEPHVEEAMEPESEGTQEMWSEGVTGKRPRKVSVVSSPIRQSAPMVKRARSRHSTPMSTRKADSHTRGSQAAATSCCG